MEEGGSTQARGYDRSKYDMIVDDEEIQASH